MDHHNKLYIDKWFKLPPKASEKVYIIELKERKHGYKKSCSGPFKKKSKKRG